MKRSYLRVGDKSSVDGTVIEGIPKCTHHGKEITYVGAQVICPACKTTGRIEAKGPRWPGTMMGKMRAMEGDTCACKCSPPPVMVASQDSMFESFDSNQLTQMGFSAEGNSLAHEASTHDQHFRIINSDGEPVEGLPYVFKSSDGSIVKGITSSNGATDLLSADDAHHVDLHLNIERGE